MADKNVGVALILSAYDKASGTVNSAMNKVMGKMEQVRKASMKIAEGITDVYAAKKGLDVLQKTANTYGDIQAAQNELRISMLNKNGQVDNTLFTKLTTQAEFLSDKYGENQEGYLKMMELLKGNRIDPKDIYIMSDALGALAKDLHVVPDEGALFAARMRNDLQIAAKDMPQMFDMLSALHHANQQLTGSQSITEMTEFFGKMSLNMATLDIKGLKASKTMGQLGAAFMAKGLSGSTVGTNFRRMFDAAKDVEKVKKVNQVAALFHKHLEFFDKKGKFLGPENFAQQIEKLNGLNPQAISAIFQSFAGKQGLSTDFVEYIAKDGLGAIKEFQDTMNNQASVIQKNNVRMEGQIEVQKRMQQAWRNTKAQFGSAISAPYSKIMEILKKATLALDMFLKQHPKLAQFIATFIAISSAAAMLLGVIKIFKGIQIAMTLLNITMAANPFILIAMAAIVAVSLVITYWKPISSFFSKIWNKVSDVFIATWKAIKGFILNYTPIGLIFRLWKPLTGFFSAIWNAVKAIFGLTFRVIKFMVLNFTPAGLIFKHWNALVPYFQKLWSFIKKIFNSLKEWVFNWAKGFFDSGAKIVDSLVSGITSKITKATEVIKKVTQKIRDFFPFSPAKEGPLRDIHKIKLIETIAASINPKSMIEALHATLGTVNGYLHGSPLGIPVTNNSSSMVSGIHFNPIINLYGSATEADGHRISDNLKQDFERMMRDYNNNKTRIGFNSF